MFLMTNKCDEARSILEPSQYAIQPLNSIVAQLGSNSNDKLGYIDAFIIDDESFNTILKNTTKQDLEKKVQTGSVVFVLTKNVYPVASPKIKFISSKNVLANQIEKIKVSPVEINVHVTEPEPVNITVEEEKRPEPQSLPIKEKIIEYHEEEEKEPVYESDPEINHIVTLQNLNLFDLIRIAKDRDANFKILMEQLEALHVKLKVANPNDINVIADEYLKQEDIVCTEIVNKFKIIINELAEKFNNDIDGKVDGIYKRALMLSSVNMFGMTQEDISKLIDDKIKVINALSDLLNEIIRNYSNVGAVATSISAILTKYSFCNDNSLPLVYDRKSFNDKRFALYQDLVTIKVNFANNRELTDKIEYALALLRQGIETQDKIMNIANNANVIKFANAGVDLLYDSDEGVYTALRLLIVKNKALYARNLIVVDETQKFKDIVKFDNNLTYVTTVPATFEEGTRYIVVCTGGFDRFKDVSHFYYPTTFSKAEMANNNCKALVQTVNTKYTIIVTPGDQSMYSRLSFGNVIIIPYLNILAEDKPFEDLKMDQNIYKYVNLLR